jgi:hypothetical protein
MFVDDKYYLCKPKRAARDMLEDAKSTARAMGYPRRKKGLWVWERILGFIFA